MVRLQLKPLCLKGCERLGQNPRLSSFTGMKGVTIAQQGLWASRSFCIGRVGGQTDFSPRNSVI